MMTRRDPFYEQPLIEEDQSNITAQTVSYIEASSQSMKPNSVSPLLAHGFAMYKKVFD